MALWTPAEITTLRWYKADALSLSDGDYVGSWTDLSPNTDHAVQSVEAQKPIFKTNIVNGLPIVRFYGDDVLEFAEIFDTAGSAGSIFVVVKKTGGLEGSLVSTRGSAGGGTTLRLNTATTAMYFHTGYTPNLSLSIIDGSFNLIEIIRDGVSIITGVNGSVSSPQTLSGYATSAQNKTLIGAEQLIYSYLIGDIEEIIILPVAADTAVRQYVEGYVMHRCGLQGNLPADHPHKSSAPTIPDTTVRAILDQSYGLIGDLVRSALDQIYHITTNKLSSLDQRYGLRLLAILDQFYTDKSVRKQILEQYWGSSAELKRALQQPYRDKSQVISSLDQPYKFLLPLLSRLNQLYSLIGGQVLSSLDQPFSIEDNNKIKTAMQQRYMILAGGTSEPISVPIVIGQDVVPPGVAASPYGGFDINYSIEEYCGLCNVIVNNEQVWNNINYLDPITLTVGSDVYNFVVTEKYKTESAGKWTFKVQGRSHSVILDFPNATEIKDDSLVSGLCSDIVDSIAAIGGKTINWLIPADESITAKDLQISGSSPMAAIKKIVNEFRGIVQTSPDGTIRAIPSYPVDTNKYPAATITRTIDALKEVVSCEWVTEKRQGYNKYFVANQGATNGYNLDSKTISETVDHIMASIVPWSNLPVYLTTSELTNVWIEAKGITEETLEEEVEIKNGAGKLQKPYYGTVSVDYGTRTNLGTPTFTEDGSVSVGSSGSSMVMIKYKTRYWLWEVTGTDKENVQYILMSL